MSQQVDLGNKLCKPASSRNVQVDACEVRFLNFGHGSFQHCLCNRIGARALNVYDGFVVILQFGKRANICLLSLCKRSNNLSYVMNRSIVLVQYTTLVKP